MEKQTTQANKVSDIELYHRYVRRPRLASIRFHCHNNNDKTFTYQNIQQRLATITVNYNSKIYRIN